jgi:hypothetical protein
MKRNVILTSIVILVLTIGIVLNTLDITEITVKLAGYEEVCTNTTIVEKYVLIDAANGNCENLCETECYYSVSWFAYPTDGDYVEYGNDYYCSGESWKTSCFNDCIDDRTPHLFFYNETICIENRLVKTLKR